MKFSKFTGFLGQKINSYFSTLVTGTLRKVPSPPPPKTEPIKEQLSSSGNHRVVTQQPQASDKHSLYVCRDSSTTSSLGTEHHLQLANNSASPWTWSRSQSKLSSCQRIQLVNYHHSGSRRDRDSTLVSKYINSPFAAYQSRAYHGGHTHSHTYFKPRRGTNIVLIGSPGAGKTSVARALGRMLGMRVIDVNDHVLEPKWGMSVAEKLAEVGEKKFLELEAQTLMSLKVDRCIISLTGSQPMNDDAMAHAKSLGALIYLDVDERDILGRLAEMKVDRIIGVKEGTDMDVILAYRRQFYERHYDLRVICPRNEPVTTIAKMVKQVSDRYRNERGFSSTRSDGRMPDSFVEVTVQGLAPDRGLYVSNATIPTMTSGQWERLVDGSYTDVAHKILEQWISRSEIRNKDLRAFINKAYTDENFGHPDIAPIVPLEKNQYLLELFHGPTASFKDIPLQLTAQLFEYAAKRTDNELRFMILVATSGDTGGAVLNAFSRHTDTSDVVVLFPEDGVSSIQKAQLTAYQGPRSHAYGVNGDFDLCQTKIKDLFVDQEYAERLSKRFGYWLSAANSINYARLLPQVVYHAWSYLQMVRDGHISMGSEIDICVPTGNFGNILGAYYAKRMGLPIRHMTVASNTNNVLHEFFTTGVFDIRERTLLTTVSPAIDILKSSNLERYLYAASGNDYITMTVLFNHLEEHGWFSIPTDSKLFHTMCKDFKSDWCSDEESMKTIKDVFKRTGYLIDPHTAVAKTVADKNKLGEDVPLVISATAHYSKFPGAVLTALGLRSETHTSCPSELMLKALELTERPPKHRKLWEDVKKSRAHPVITDPTTENIKETIEKFVCDYYDVRRTMRKRR